MQKQKNKRLNLTPSTIWPQLWIILHLFAVLRDDLQNKHMQEQARSLLTLLFMLSIRVGINGTATMVFR